jgi:AcrR family transcriptional regulator
VARSLSDEKREALLAAAIEHIAVLGLSAPTAKIAKTAGVAEGTLFTYFASKDELLNQLYLHIKADMARVMMSDYPHEADIHARSLHVWNRYVGWGAANPQARQAMRQLTVSDRITTATRSEGAAAFQDVSAMIDRSLAEGVVTAPSAAFVGALLEALADATLEFMDRDAGRASAYRDGGFRVLWRGIGS